MAENHNVASLLFAEYLRRLHEAYKAIPTAWQSTDAGLIRLVIKEPLPDNAVTSSTLRGFMRRTGFEIAGSTARTTRLFVASLGTLLTAADAIEQRDAGPGKALINNYLGLRPMGDVGLTPLDEIDDDVRRRVEHAPHDLLICYHNDDVGGDPWPGIKTMLESLGGTKIHKWTGVSSLGYGSTTIARSRADEIVTHPLVRHVGPVGKLSLS